MIVEGLVFYFFSTALLIAGATVITIRNSVHSVMFLILAFILASGLFILMGAEFLAMTLIIVYVGAVAVLFLFVVMMLDVNVTKLRQGFNRYLPIGCVIGIVLLLELVMVADGWTVTPLALAKPASPIPPSDLVSNSHALGQVLYTQYAYLFQAAGLILLVAMIGAIVLSLRGHSDSLHQNISDQVGRRPQDVVTLRKVPPGGGI
ncbi:MAG: NADH-quinone oxidoreductase subunit J [Rhodospirillaceae bacterium]